MGTVIDTVQGRALFPEGILHPACHPYKIFLIVLSPGDTGLVGYNNKGISLLSDVPAGIKQAVNKLNVFNPVEVFPFPVDHPVPVE
jgi:hypothetical protein